MVCREDSQSTRECNQRTWRRAQLPGEPGTGREPTESLPNGQNGPGASTGSLSPVGLWCGCRLLLQRKIATNPTPSVAEDQADGEGNDENDRQHNQREVNPGDHPSRGNQTLPRGCTP